MENQVAWHLTNQETDPIQHLNFIRWIMQWRNGRTMNRFISGELDKRFADYQSGKAGDNANKRRKAVIDVILDAYMADKSTSKNTLDSDFRDFAVRQIRLFAFVGQGSTTASISYAIHLLNTNPETLERIRAEHDEAFGPDLATASAALSNQSHLLNQLRYTKAVIKEATRLFPAASSIRQGCEGEDLVDDDGTRYPTENCSIWTLHPAMHRSPSYWPKPNDFIPERWLVEPGHDLYPLKGAWRPFEVGPRNCIGQDLVMVEMTVTLVMLVRDFDFRPAYDEWDRMHPKKGPQTYRGDRAYSVEAGAMRPADGYPCYVKTRENGTL